MFIFSSLTDHFNVLLALAADNGLPMKQIMSMLSLPNLSSSIPNAEQA